MHGYRYFILHSHLIRVALDGNGRKKCAERYDRETGQFVIDHRFLSRLETEWEAEQVTEEEFRRLM